MDVNVIGEGDIVEWVQHTSGNPATTLRGAVRYMTELASPQWAMIERDEWPFRMRIKLDKLTRVTAAPQPAPAVDDDDTFLAAQAGSISAVVSDYSAAVAMGLMSGVEG